MRFHTRLGALAGGFTALVVALAACSSDDGNTNIQSRLRSLSGSLAGLGGTKAKITAIVGKGDAKKQIPAALDAANGTFRFDDLPEGPKSIVVEQGGQSRTVKFGLAQDADKRTAVIPETQLATDSFDLGALTVASTGDYVEAQHNPLAELIDTDGDGLFDFFDEDIDGDGLFNWDDDAFFGDWDDYEDWGWDDDDFLFEDWDCDGDGIADWEDWDVDLSAEACGWEEDWDQYWEDEYWEDYDDGYWEDDTECLDPEFCDDWSGDDWSEDDWSEDDWSEEDCLDPEFCDDWSGDDSGT